MVCRRAAITWLSLAREETQLGAEALQMRSTDGARRRRDAVDGGWGGIVGPRGRGGYLLEIGDLVVALDLGGRLDLTRPVHSGSNSRAGGESFTCAGDSQDTVAQR